MDIEVAKDHVAGGIGIVVIAAVITVDSVVDGIANLEIVNDEITHPRQVHAFGRIFDNGLRPARNPANPDRFLVGTGQIADLIISIIIVATAEIASAHPSWHRP